jgi:uncharacterized membrane protein HdeD (DUF308 family)
MAMNTDNTRRPILLRISVFLVALLGVLVVGVWLYGLFGGFGFSYDSLGMFSLLFAFGALVPGILELVVARALWNFRWWAWLLAVAGHSVAGVWILLATASTDITRVQSLMALSLLMLVACLLTPLVMRAIWRERFT